MLNYYKEVRIPVPESSTLQDQIVERILAVKNEIDRMQEQSRETGVLIANLENSIFVQAFREELYAMIFQSEIRSRINQFWQFFTAAGAVEALREKWVPVFVLDHPYMPEGNKLLLKKRFWFFSIYFDKIS